MSTQPTPLWYQRVPKTELHVHMEGSIPHEALWELTRKYGDASLSDLDALKAKFKYRDFPHFIQTWLWKNQFLREYEDFAFIAEAVAASFRDQNILYAEMFYSPPDFFDRGLEPGRLTEAVRSGLSKITGVEIMLVPDLVRDFGAELAARTLEQVAEVRELGVIGIGIGGSENEFHPLPFKPVYERARELDLRTSAHAGEADGPESVWSAIRDLRVDRVGHGTRATEDAALVDFLAEQQTILEMCPLSNLRTGVVDSISQHPIRQFFDLGIPVTVNSDDPSMFGNSLAAEYSVLEKELGFTTGEIQELILNGIRCSWLPAHRKEALMQRFVEHPHWSPHDN